MLDSKILGGILLIAGTAIGAGMLAMPISTGIVGFNYAVLIILLTFIYMLACLFLLLEAKCHCKGSSIISMARDKLGNIGSYIAWISFLMLMYSASAAYIAGGSSILHSIGFINHKLDHDSTCVIFASIFAIIGFIGIRFIDLINRFCMLGLCLAYFALVFTFGPHVNISNLSGSNPSLIWATIPILILSFTSHIILPSLKEYYGNDLKKLKKVLILGSLVPLIVYLVWELLMLGVIPHSGENSLYTVAKSSNPLVTINQILLNKNITGIATANASFSFFALITSYLGVILSLSDFIADGLNLKKDINGRIIANILTSVPPLLFAIYFPNGFITALSYAGVFVAILFCILPVIIVWQARYKYNQKSEYKFPIGKAGLVVIALVGIMIIILQILANNNYLPQV